MNRRPKNPESTSTGAQERRIVEALRRGPKTTDELRAIGAYQVSARVFGLRRLGFVIDTELFNGVSSDGYSHARMARYTLVSEPEAVAVGEPRKRGGDRAGDGRSAGA